jgi:hypothetical protein
LPSKAPALLSDDDASKRVVHGKDRLKIGESPRIVARDLLLAGVPPWMVRRALFGVAATVASSDKSTKRWNVFGFLSWMFLGAGVFVGDRRRGLADPSEVVGGTDEIDRWEENFGVQTSSGGAG